MSGVNCSSAVLDVTLGVCMCVCARELESVYVLDGQRPEANVHNVGWREVNNH